ncbi:MAG: tRNA (N6-isopentenyl adenosine(37)-C2)-methylthiotransferase MiaB [Candidatus Omnitrophica bacterium]|nr:tRNA (N6-isopentenyl adenosine(37)-C2)-methylthiotransferase MiaB [Candidatus Omnitrophota bacterium]
MYIRTIGCQMNTRDSEVVKGLLSVEGYEMTDDPKKADVVLFNTCSVRDHAEQRVWSGIGLLSRKKNRPLIGILGCMAQNFKQEIFQRARAVDLVCGPAEIDNIALYLEEALKRQDKVLAVGERRRRGEIYHTGFYDKRNHAYIVVSEGCDNYCSYCVVPYVRGRLRHRPAEEIVREAQAAVDAGITSITLLGQNVSAYLTEDRVCGFPALLEKVAKVKGLKSLSFITSHPKDTKKELFEAMRDIPVVRKYLHMPAQSGSDRVLAMMNRGYTAKIYRELVDLYCSIVYNGELSSDFIVGFPTESEEDFRATHELVKGVRFDSAFIFKYSARPHTKAAELPDDVPQGTKKRRHAELLELQKSISQSLKHAKTA